MSTVKEIESDIGALPRNEFFELIALIKSQFEDEWDRQIADDIKAGRLDNLAREALAEYRAGRAGAFPADEKPCNQ